MVGSSPLPRTLPTNRSHDWLAKWQKVKLERQVLRFGFIKRHGNFVWCNSTVRMSHVHTINATALYILLAMYIALVKQNANWEKKFRVSVKWYLKEYAARGYVYPSAETFRCDWITDIFQYCSNWITRTGIPFLFQDIYHSRLHSRAGGGSYFSNGVSSEGCQWTVALISIYLQEKFSFLQCTIIICLKKKVFVLLAACGTIKYESSYATDQGAQMLGVFTRKRVGSTLTAQQPMNTRVTIQAMRRRAGSGTHPPQWMGTTVLPSLPNGSVFRDLRWVNATDQGYITRKRSHSNMPIRALVAHSFMEQLPMN